MKPIKAVSLFNGISGGRLSFQRAGIEVGEYISFEIDENANKISKRNFPNDTYLGDVRKADFRKYGDADILIGGSPCQGFSRQGKGLNFEDPRSKLFFEYVRALKEIRETNKDVLFFLENVCMKKEWEDVISDYLEVEPVEVNSKLVSAQNRPRMYWTNIKGFKQPEDRNITLKSILDKVDTSKFVDRNGILFERGFSENSMDLVYDIDGEILIRQSVKKGYIIAEDGDGVNLSFPNSKSRRGRVIKKKSSTLDCACNIGVYTNGVIRRFTISELEKLQTLPVGYTYGVSDVARRKAIGNGWNIDTIAEFFKCIKL